MSARRATLAGLAALVATFTVQSARAATGIRVAPARATFPERALVLTLPTREALDSRSVQVLEDGHAVDGLRVVPARAASARSFGFVLALDASNSMRGAPEAAALAAAGAFAAQRSASASLGLVTFGSAASVALAPSTDASAIASAFGRVPAPSEGTRLRDGVAEAISLLSRSGIRAGSVVVLSDGADVGSRASFGELVAQARAAGVRVFTVGLRSPQFAAEALRALSAATGGRYVEAASEAALEPIYRALGRTLAGEYLVRYGSDAAAGRRVHVTVRVAGLAGEAGFDYDAPALRAATFHEGWQQRFWRSRVAGGTIAALVALLAAGTAVLLLRSVRRAPSDRVAAYASVPPRRRIRGQRLGEQLVPAVDRALARLRGWRDFAAEVEISRLPVTAPALAAAAALAALLVGPLPALLATEPLLLALGLVPPLAARALVKHRLRGVRRRFEDELPENLQVLASALRTGHGLSSALTVVVREASEPARSEFERALADERLGARLEDALASVASRMASDDLEQVALVAALHRQTGGNTAEVLDRVHDAIRERAELRRTVRSLTAEGRMTRWILSALPVAMAGGIALLDPGYLQPFLASGIGRLLVAVAVAMVVAGSLIIKRIVEIDP